MTTAVPEVSTGTKDRLLDAAQRLFARDGVQGARIREINKLAGQRNPSALHYHFGSRTALVEAILIRYQAGVDAQTERRIDELERSGVEVGIRELVEASVGPIVETLDTQAGRDCVRIVPQMLPALSRNLRRGVAHPTTPQTHKTLAALEQHMAGTGITESLRRERLVTYALVITTLLGERAHQLEEPAQPLLDSVEFTTHVVDTLTALLLAPAA